MLCAKLYEIFGAQQSPQYILVEIALGEFARMLEWLHNLRSLCGSCNSLDVQAHKSARYVSAASEVHNTNTLVIHPVMKIDNTNNYNNAQNNNNTNTPCYMPGNTLLWILMH